MTDLTTERPMKIQVIGQDFEEYPASASNILEGMMVGLTSNYARKFTLGDNFVGHAKVSCLNSGNSAGDMNVRVYKGRYRARVALPNVAITDNNRQVAVYATDSGGLSLRVGFKVGRVIRYVSSGIALVEFDTHPQICEWSETVLRADMTDNSNATGYKDLTMSIPADSQILGVIFDTKTAFIGDTSFVYQLGIAGNLDNFTAVTTTSGFTTGRRGVQAPGATDNTYLAAATSPRLTGTSASDFTNVSAGEVDVKVRYIPPSA